MGSVVPHCARMIERTHLEYVLQTPRNQS